MVSHTQILESSAPAPAPSASASVPLSTTTSSRHSHASRRHHRSHRSHHGGSSRSAQNDFPIFSQSGDVEIVICANGHERRYLLHRLILAQCSGFFEASMSEEWSRGTTTTVGGGGGGPPSCPQQGSASAGADGSLFRISEDDSFSVGSTLVQSENGSGFNNPSNKRRWRYELDWENKAEDEDPILVQKQPSHSPMLGGSGMASTTTTTTTKPSVPMAGFLRSMAHLDGGMQSASSLSHTGRPTTADAANANVDPLIRDYDNLFRLFYNYPPTLNSVNIASAYTECKSLLALADMYDALSVTAPRVDHHLLGFGSRLFKQISKYPPSYLKLGYLARSRVIFTEALIHVVGQWPAALPNLRNGSYPPIPNSVLDLVEDKFEDLEDLKARVESKLFRLSLTTSRGERVNPNNAYLEWLAVSLFRQWLIDSTTPPPPPILKNSPNSPSIPPIPPPNTVISHGRTVSRPQDLLPSTVDLQTTTTTATSSSSNSSPSTPSSPAQVYRLIGSYSTQAYLPHDELKKFLKLHPTSSSDCLYTRDVLKRFERRMDEIKRLAREIVKPLMRNFLELDRAGDARVGRLPYLTCTRVEEGDLPW